MIYNFLNKNNLISNGNKVTILYLVSILYSSCNQTHSIFVEKNIRIVMPVSQLKDGQGNAMVDVYKDGGTKCIRIVDAENHTFYIYFDHRVDKKSEWGTVYIGGYPDKPGSLRIVDQDRFKKIVLRTVKCWE